MALLFILYRDIADVLACTVDKLDVKADNLNTMRVQPTHIVQSHIYNGYNAQLHIK